MSLGTDLRIEFAKGLLAQAVETISKKDAKIQKLKEKIVRQRRFLETPEYEEVLECAFCGILCYTSHTKYAIRRCGCTDPPRHRTVNDEPNYACEQCVKHMEKWVDDVCVVCQGEVYWLE